MLETEKLHEVLIRKLYIVDAQMAAVRINIEDVGREEKQVLVKIVNGLNEDFDILQFHLRCLEIRLDCLDTMIGRLGIEKSDTERRLREDFIN